MEACVNYLRIKTQLLKRPQRGIVVDGAAHSQKDGVEGNGGSLLEGWSRGLFAVPTWRSADSAV